MTSVKATAAARTGERSPTASPAQGSRAPVTLAQQLGNQNLQLLLQARVLQAKLTVSPPHDVYEQEADRVAEQVMRMADPAAPATVQRTPLVQRSCCRDCEEELHRSEESAASTPTVTAATEEAIHSLSGRGSALPDAMRSFMEPRFNASFSGVRVHNDAHAHELARSVNAQAFTVGQNVVFGAGHYAPHTESGKRLLAHELTHVVQQSGDTQQIQRQPAFEPTPMPNLRGEGSMARDREKAKARDDVDQKHWRLPELQRSVTSSQFTSTEARRWYTEAFLRYHYRKYVGEELSVEQLEHDMVYFENVYQKTKSPHDLRNIPISAASMSWVDDKMHPQPSVAENMAEAGKRYEAYQRLIQSKDYQIMQRPFEERFNQTFYSVREKVLTDQSGPSTSHYDSAVAIVPARELWDYGVQHDLFAKVEWNSVVESVAKQAVKTYEKRYKKAHYLTHLHREIGEYDTPERIWDYGYNHYLFLSGEKTRVFHDGGKDLEDDLDREQEKFKARRRQFESEQYQAHVARGEQLSSPAPFIQPFAYAALGPLVGAAYAGSQTGLLAGETYNACVNGEGNCAGAVVQVGVAVATHYVARGLSNRSPSPRGVTRPSATIPESVTVAESEAVSTVPQTTKPQTTKPPAPPQEPARSSSPTNPKSTPSIDPNATHSIDPNATHPMATPVGGSAPAGSRPLKPPPVPEKTFSKPVYTDANEIGEGQFKKAYRADGQVVSVPKDPANWDEVDTNIALLDNLRRRNNGAFKRYTAEAYGPYEIQGRRAMVAPEYGEGSRSIVAPDRQGGWSIRGKSKYLNQTSIDDIKRINELQHQHNVDIWDKQYLVGKDGHVYLSDPMRVRTGTPTNYDLQDQLLIEVAKRNIARQGKP